MGTHVRLQVKSRESVMITNRMLTVTTWKCYLCISPEVLGEQLSHQDEMLGLVNISGKPLICSHLYLHVPMYHS